MAFVVGTGQMAARARPCPAPALGPSPHLWELGGAEGAVAKGGSCSPAWGLGLCCRGAAEAALGGGDLGQGRAQRPPLPRPSRDAPCPRPLPGGGRGGPQAARPRLSQGQRGAVYGDVGRAGGPPGVVQNLGAPPWGRWGQRRKAGRGPLVRPPVQNRDLQPGCSQPGLL